MSEPAISFNMSFATMFIAMLINLAIFMVPLLLLFTILIGEIVVASVISMVLVTVLFAAGFAWIQGRKPTLVLHPDGMEIYDTRARLQYAPWSSISNITQHSRLGWRFLKLDVQGLDRQLLVPLYLADMSRFYSSLAELAGTDHPLTRAVRESGAAG